MCFIVDMPLSRELGVILDLYYIIMLFCPFKEYASKFLASFKQRSFENSVDIPFAVFAWSDLMYSECSVL